MTKLWPTAKFRGLSIVALICGLAPTVRAGDIGQYVISAKAGGVNLVSGSVMFQHKGSTHWQPLAPKEQLAAGDTVRTESGSRLETLLNPGSYLRLGDDSQFELTDPSLNNLRVKLLRGSAIIEATGFGGATLLTEIDTPQTKIEIVQNGLYRIDVRPGSTELFVRKGRALVGSDAPVRVKRGKKIVVSGPDDVDVAKFDKKSQDAFDTWSQERAETLVAASRKLSTPSLGYSIVSAMNSGWGFDPWDYRGGLGVWIYDPRLACRIFYPFYAGIGSPYGYGYANGLGLWPGYYRPSPPPSGSWGNTAAGRQPSPPGIASSTPPRDGPRFHPGADLPVRPGPVDRRVEREIQARASRDLPQRGGADSFARSASQASHAAYSATGSGSGPSRGSAPARANSSSAGREPGGGGRAIAVPR